MVLPESVGGGLQPLSAPGWYAYAVMLVIRAGL